MTDNATNEILWTRTFTLTMLGMFFLFTPFALYLPVMPVYLLQELHSSMAAAGAVNGVFLIAAVLFRAQTARIEARFGNRRVYLVSGLLFMGTNICYLAATTVAGIMVIRFISGACFAIANTGIQAMASRLIPRSRTGEGLAYITTMVLAGSAVGPYLGLSLSHSLGYHAVFILSALASLLGMLILCSLKCPDARPRLQPRCSFHTLYERQAIPVSMILLMIAIAYGGVLTFVAMYAAELHLAAAAGKFFVMMAIASVAARLLTGRMYDRFGPDSVIYPAISIMAAGLLGLGFIRSTAGMLSAAALIGIGYGMAVPAIQTLAIQLSPAHRTSEATATVFTCLDGGVGLGAYLLGGSILAFGYAKVYLALGLLTLACTCFYYAMRRQAEAEKTNPLREITEKESS
jgi:MFS family permease